LIYRGYRAVSKEEATDLYGTKREREVSIYFASSKSPGFQILSNHKSAGCGDITVTKWDCGSEREAEDGSESCLHDRKKRQSKLIAQTDDLKNQGRRVWDLGPIKVILARTKPLL
jgi:hypothetical protein